LHGYWLILYLFKNSPTPVRDGNQRTHTLRGKQALFIVFVCLLSLLGHNTAFAGFFSLIKERLVYVGGQEASVSQFLNSQTIPLLQPAVNQNPHPARGGGDTIIVGNALLADSGPLGTIADIEETPPSDQISLYVVRGGDTIGEIAEMFGVSPSTILWANDLTRGSKVSPGQTLVILPVSGVRHTVKKGDTVSSIAKRYGADSEEIAQFNGIDVHHPLIVGALIIVPDGDAPSSSNIRITDNSTKKSISGYFIKPLARSLRSQGIHGYNGIDLAAPVGTTIMAAASGQVIVSRSSGWNGGYGNYVVIKHGNGTQTLYAHMDSITVSQGILVEQGAAIGTIGMTGRSTGAHLHFEVRGAQNPF